MKIATFADRLNEALKIKQINAADLARQTKISEGLVSGYKHGKFEPKQKKLDIIARVLNVSIPWLMGGDVPMGTYDGNNNVKFEATAEEQEQIIKIRQLSKLGQQTIKILVENLFQIENNMDYPKIELTEEDKKKIDEILYQEQNSGYVAAFGGDIRRVPPLTKEQKEQADKILGEKSQK